MSHSAAASPDPAPRDEPVVRDAPDRDRFEILVDGEVAGVITYRRRGDAFALLHTEVEPAFEGRGLGSTLVRGALDRVRADGGHVLPHCPFVRRFVSRHPDYLDLVAAADRARFDLPPAAAPPS